MMDEPILKIDIGTTEYGCCDFAVTLDHQIWKCGASFISENPLQELLYAIIDIYFHFDQKKTDTIDWDIIVDHGGSGICIRLSPDEHDRMYLAIYNFYDVSYPDPNQYSRIPPVAERFISFWSLAEAVHNTASQCLRQQSLTEMRLGWFMQSHAWKDNSRETLFPLEHYLYLSQILGKNPKLTISLKGEPKIIQQTP